MKDNFEKKRNKFVNDKKNEICRSCTRNEQNEKN